VLYGADAQPVLRSRRIAHLPLDPGRSDIEVFLSTPNNLVLAEDAEQTLSGIMKSTSCLIETFAHSLRELWRWRRDHPTDLVQPRDQWKNGPSAESTGFKGYAPSGVPFDPGLAMIHPDVARRFHTAAVHDQARRQWAGFD
jgi:hypothetical protein